MQDIRFDEDGEPRCWNCGSKAFQAKRTTRSKLAGGIAAITLVGAPIAAAGVLSTKKKLKCLRCGEYNDVGDGKPYEGPASEKYR